MNLEEGIKEIFFNTFPNMLRDDFEWERKQKDYDEWDSLAGLNLITLTESKFNISFTVDDAISIISAKDLLEFVKSRQ